MRLAGSFACSKTFSEPPFASIDSLDLPCAGFLFFKEFPCARG
jgi:hypothetical protein